MHVSMKFGGYPHRQLTGSNCVCQEVACKKATLVASWQPSHQGATYQCRNDQRDDRNPSSIVSTRPPRGQPY